MLKEARDIDAVAIFTEAPNHEKHVRMSMQRGWHVISAVPACLTLEEAERLKQIKEQTGLKIHDGRDELLSPPLHRGTTTL